VIRLGDYIDDGIGYWSYVVFACLCVRTTLIRHGAEIMTFYDSCSILCYVRVANSIVDLDLNRNTQTPSRLSIH
jgi:hypothetical protein